VRRMRCRNTVAVLTRLLAMTPRPIHRLIPSAPRYRQRRSPCRRLITLIRPSQPTRHRWPRRTSAAVQTRAFGRFPTRSRQDHPRYAAGVIPRFICGRRKPAGRPPRAPVDGQRSADGAPAPAPRASHRPAAGHAPQASQFVQDRRHHDGIGCGDDAKRLEGLTTGNSERRQVRCDS
jgi:hypothetical protein